jgi:hypothetical protein
MPLVLTLMLGALLGGLAAALTAAATTEVLVAGAHRDGTALVYGAEAGAEYAVAALAVSDWETTVDGAIETLYASGALGDFTDLPSAGVPTTVAIRVSDLSAVYGVTEDESRVARVTATAVAPHGARRTVRMVVRLSRVGEEVQIERLSWTP